MNFNGVNAALTKSYLLLERLDNPAKPLGDAGRLLEASIDRNIEVGGRPTFAAHAPSTTAARNARGTGSTILDEYGDMRGGVTTLQTGFNSIEVGSDAVQARRMQHGWEGHTPARPWVLYQPEDIDAVGRLFSTYYAGAF